MPPFRLVKVRNAEETAAATALFREYADWLGIDLCFQDFEQELKTLPGKYAPPEGELILAYSDVGDALGCVGVRPLEGTTVCEMKRLYVRACARGRGLGRVLVGAIIDAAEELGYAEMKLDTLPWLDSAIALYGQFGFAEIAAYYDNPTPGVRYFGKRLTPKPSSKTDCL
jgi:GNAT superfamily N-acetyltransferase